MQERMLVEFDNARVLVTDMKIEAIKDIIPILEQISRLNQPLLIIAVRDAVASRCNGLRTLSMSPSCSLVLQERSLPHSKGAR